MLGSLAKTILVIAAFVTVLPGIAGAKRLHFQEPQPFNLTELKAQVADNLHLNVDAQTQFYWRDDDQKKNPGFSQTVSRWSARDGPKFDLVVHVMREADVAAVVGGPLVFVRRGEC